MNRYIAAQVLSAAALNEPSLLCPHLSHLAHGKDDITNIMNLNTTDKYLSLCYSQVKLNSQVTKMDS